MVAYCYAFECTGIQKYIGAGGKLRDTIAGSDMLDAFCNQPLTDILEACGLCDAASLGEGMQPVRFSRRAGGAFRVFTSAQSGLLALRDMISLVMPQFAPGLSFTHALAGGETAMEASAKASRGLIRARNRVSISLPEAGPLALRCPRTGLAAIATRDKEVVDADLLQKRRWDKAGRSEPQGLASRLLASEPNIVWPLQIDQQETHLPAIVEQSGGGAENVAVVHADGNGLGLLLIRLNEVAASSSMADDEYVDALRGFSQALEQATRQAADDACREVLLPVAREHQNERVLPARPLVLGGDDLTFIVRADLALSFSKRFLRSFEQRIVEVLGRWRETLPADMAIRIPINLSAAAGIAYVKPRMPFTQSYALTEQLCRQAKDAAAAEVANGEIKPSSLSFARATSSLIGSPEELIGFMPHNNDETTVPLGLPAYVLESLDPVTLPCIDDLEALASHLRNAGDGKPLRAILNLMQSDPVAARNDYQRWWNRRAKRGKNANAHWARYTLGADADDSLPLVRLHGKTFSPLGDLITLMSMSASAHEETAHD